MIECLIIIGGFLVIVLFSGIMINVFYDAYDDVKMGRKSSLIEIKKERKK